MDKKLTKTLIESATLVSIAAGLGYLSKKVLKTSSLTNDPSSSLENYAKWTAVLTVAIYTRDYLEKEKILPS